MRFPHTRVLPELPRTCSLSTLPRRVQPFSSVHVCGAKNPSLGKQERRRKKTSRVSLYLHFLDFKPLRGNHENADTAAERTQEILFPPPPHAPTPASPVEFPNPRPVANPRGCVTLRAPHRPSAPHGAVRRRRSRPTDPPSLTPQPPTRGVGGEELRRGNPPTRPQTSSSPRTNDTGRLPPSAPRLARTWPGAWRTILSPRPVPAPQSGREEGGDGNASPVRRATVGPPRGC